MKKTLPMLAAAAIAAVMFSTDASALCVSVKTNVQTKDNNSARTEQKCDYNVSASTQRGNKNEFSSDQKGKTNKVLSNQIGGRNKFEGRQTGTGGGNNEARINQRTPR
jgi:hypothetical protein